MSPKDREDLEAAELAGAEPAEGAPDEESDDEDTGVINVPRRLKRLSREHRALRREVRSIDSEVKSTRGEVAAVCGEVAGLRAGLEMANDLTQQVIEKSLGFAGAHLEADLTIKTKRAASAIDGEAAAAEASRKEDAAAKEWRRRVLYKVIAIVGTVATAVGAAVTSMIHQC